MNRVRLSLDCYLTVALLKRMSNKTTQDAKDDFGNPIDPTVGYARGTILRSSTEENQRLVYGQRLATARLAEQGPASITVFTGNQRAFPALPDDLELRCEEWFGPGIILDELKANVIGHMDGSPDDDFALFNRSSAGIIALIAALAEGRPVVSGVPSGSRSHASVIRGCRIVQSALHEHDGFEDFRQALQIHQPRLVIITTVTSNLDRLDEETIAQMIQSAHKVGAIAFVDDAYGARIRPILHGGTSAMRLGADLAITNCDKAGLIGPRTGILIGRPDLVPKVAAKGAEFGMEARAPILLAAMRSLSSFTPDLLRDEQRLGSALTELMRQRFGEHIVASSDLGPIIDENDMLRLVLQRAGKPVDKADIVPAEATAALGALLLRDHGILTTNTHGQPGAKVSLRLRPTPEALERIGDMQKVVDVLDECIGKLADVLDDMNGMSKLILGYTK